MQSESITDISLSIIGSTCWGPICIQALERQRLINVTGLFFLESVTDRRLSDGSPRKLGPDMLNASSYGFRANLGKMEFSL